jgi:hypothetical protein
MGFGADYPGLPLVQAPTATGTLFGWTIQCRSSSGCSNNGDMIQVGGVYVTAQETQGPSVSVSGGLGAETGWVRGMWPVDATADGPSGVCDLYATLNGQVITPIAPYAASTPNQTVWHQCPTATMSPVINTQSYGSGPVPLTFTDSDAAGLGGTTAVHYVDIDNSVPSLQLSGPITALSTAGTAYVTASAAGSPSGIASIVCAVDGGSSVSYSGATAQVPVSGLGPHIVRCVAEDNAVDAAGAHGSSLPSLWSLDVVQPTQSIIAFARIRAHCKGVNRRVRTTHWVTVRRHGHKVRVKRRGRVRVERVRVCHATGAARKKWRARYGHRALVSGWIGTSGDIALGGRPVQVMTAPDNGLGHWTLAATVTTAANGTWSAQLPPGPGRLVEANYAGDNLDAAVNSNAVRLIVPAKVRIHISPAIVPWGHIMYVTGRVLGGYVPRGSNILRLEIGNGAKPHTIGTPEISPNGHFTIPVTWARESGVAHGWLAVATLSERDYPYARGVSRRVPITVGMPTPPSSRAAPKHHKHRARRRKKR